MKPATLRAEINRCFPVIRRPLLAASDAADGPEPAKALPHLRKAARALLAAVARVERQRR